MLKTKLNELLGIKYPIIQAGMGPFSNNNLCVASANAGALGILSTSGLLNKEGEPWVYQAYIDTAEATMADDMATVLEKVLKRTYRLTKEQGGIFGINVMVSAEIVAQAQVFIDTAIRVREETPGMKDCFKVIFTSAGDPVPWRDKIKSAGFTWIHVVPSVKGALRCKKAGVDCIVASGHEGGFHIAWEPIHTMVLLPAVIEAVDDPNLPVVGAGGFCDGKSIAAALALGAAGVHMGTRLLATVESDFPPLWKEQILKTEDRGTLVARGFVGPARWLKTPASVIHLQNTLSQSPGVFTGVPDDYTTVSPDLIEYERQGIKATFLGDRERAMMAGGECAQRISDMPTVKELLDRVVKDACEVIRNMPRCLAS